MFRHPYRYLFIAGLATYTYISTVLCEVYKYFSLSIEWYYAYGTILAVTFAGWECSKLIEPFFRKKLSIEKNKLKPLAHFFLATIFCVTLVTTAVVFLVSFVLKHHSIHGTIIPLKLNLIYAWLATLLFHLINAIVFYFEEYKAQWMKAEELKQMTTQAELQVVKNQINPHFLFNNLNVLSALIRKNNSDANRFIEAFSQVYRYLLANHDKEVLELRSELELIEPYIFLLQKRFSEGLHFNINIPEAYEKYYIIPASLQMLIENAIKHNIVSKQKPLYINIYIGANDTITVSNNLQERSSVDYSGKIGLNNIIKRYWLVSRKEVEVKKSAELFAVTLPLLNLN